MSAIDLGRPRPKNTELWRFLDGVSLDDTEAWSRAKAEQYPRMGAHIAVVAIPDDSPVLVKRTTSSDGHYTVWATSEWLLSAVVSIVSV